MGKTKVLILFGGRSAEHEVSLVSARSVYEALDRNRYMPILVGIARDGGWFYDGPNDRLLSAKIVEGRSESAIRLGGNAGELVNRHGVVLEDGSFDVVFPLLHGPYGEDGCIQGLFELRGLPYVGAGVAGSAVGMDKELSRAVFNAAGLRQTEYRVIQRSNWDENPDEILDNLQQALSYPLFVKPVNLGSSVGITKAHGTSQLIEGINLASTYDTKVMVEVAVENAREVECALLGNTNPEVSGVGEIIPNAEFYSYDAKYNDGRAELIIPADLEESVTRRVQDMAVRAFRAIDCSGLARADFLIAPDGQALINEINTMPGFTPISMYPKLWEAAGVPYPELIHRLIEYAKARYTDRASLNTSW